MTGLDFGNVACSFDAWVETLTASSYDEGSYPPIPFNQSTIGCQVTIRFTDNLGNFVGSTNDPLLADLGAGNINTDFSPVNPLFGNGILFTLEAAGWTGTPAQDDTLVFDIHGAIVYIWEKRVIPPLCGPLTGNKLTLVCGGESA